MFVSIDFCSEIGGFDENFKFYNEDQDIYIRLKEKTSIPFIKEAIVAHPVRFVSLNQRLKKAWLRYTDYVRLLRKKHHNDKIIAKSYLYHLQSIGHNLKRFKWRSIIFHLYHVIWIIPFYHIKKR